MSDARSNWSSKTGMILAATGSPSVSEPFGNFRTWPVPTAVLLLLFRLS